MMNQKITFQCTNFTTNGNGTYSMYVKPNKNNKLGQIPKGVNPRYIDKSSKIVKAIKSSFEANDNRFAVKNGGIQAAIDNGSLLFDEKTGLVCLHALIKIQDTMMVSTQFMVLILYWKKTLTPCTTIGCF